jgi:hypothetical protein
MKKLLLLTLLNFLTLFGFAQNTILADEIMVKIKNGEAVNLENKVIIGDLDLTKFATQEKKHKNNNYREYTGKIVNELNFKDCVFQGELKGFYVDGANAKIGNLDIKYNGDGDNFNIDFSKPVRFLNCTFEKNVTLKYSNFDDEVSFEKSKFLSVANFKYSKFKKAANFAKTDFKTSANFKYAIFSDETDFYAAFFNASADFKYSNFAERVTFKKASFNSFSDFKYSNFQTSGNFQLARFGTSSDFKYSKGKTYF